MAENRLRPVAPGKAGNMRLGHPILITGWKRQAIANMALSFDANPSAEPQISAGEVENLHAKIGVLVEERDFWADASRLR